MYARASQDVCVGVRAAEETHANSSAAIGLMANEWPAPSCK